MLYRWQRGEVFLTSACLNSEVSAGVQIVVEEVKNWEGHERETFRSVFHRRERRDFYLLKRLIGTSADSSYPINLPRPISYVINIPSAMLKPAAAPRKIALARAKRWAVSFAGKPIRALMIIMPPVEPIPKIRTYNSATNGCRIVDSTRSINAPLPARPWIIPITIGRRCN